jgi:hypothetical protein
MNQESIQDGLEPNDLIVKANNRVGRKIPNLVVDGRDETEILSLAPCVLTDRVHWATINEFDAKVILPDLAMTAFSRQWSDGKHRIWVPEGRGYEARELIRSWCIDHEVEPINLRVETSVPFRNVDAIPDELFQKLVLATVDWLHPRCYAIRKRIVADFGLIDDEDLRPMMYIFVSDHADRFDDNRVGKNGTLNFASFMLGKIRKWPQDAARSLYGRGLIDDQMHINQVIDKTIAEKHRKPTEAELANSLQISVEDLRERQQAVAEYIGIRFHNTIVSGADYDDVDSVDVMSEVNLELEATGLIFDATLTKAIVAAVNCQQTGRGKGHPDALGLAVVYLTYWGELSRQEVAAELCVLPKTAAAAAQRVLNAVGTPDLS